jgi:hypothetical protein
VLNAETTLLCESFSASCSAPEVVCGNYGVALFIGIEQLITTSRDRLPTQDIVDMGPVHGEEKDVRLVPRLRGPA